MSDESITSLNPYYGYIGNYNKINIHTYIDIYIYLNAYIYNCTHDGDLIISNNPSFQLLNPYYFGSLILNIPLLLETTRGFK